MEWTTEWPTELGMYWFYGYRHGKNQYFGEKVKPKLMLVEVRATADKATRMFVTNGQFMFRKETEEAHWQKAVLPETPDLGDLI